MTKQLQKKLLTAVLLLSSISTFAYDFEAGGLYYNKASNNQATVTSGDNAYTGSITIPETVENSGTTYTVTAIGSRAFYQSTSLTSVSMGNGVTSIGSEAFRGCTKLTTVHLGEGLTTIGYRAFYGCYDLEQINFPEALKTFSTYGGASETFSGCTSLTSVELGKHVTSMGSGVFSGCTGITTVKINEGCEIIGTNCFRECTKLKSIEIPASVLSIGEYNQEIKGETNVEIIPVSA